MPRSKRIVFILSLMSLVFGFGAEMSRAATAENWCADLCTLNCETCATARTIGCTCEWFCTDGDEGTQICTS